MIKWPHSKRFVTGIIQMIPSISHSPVICNVDKPTAPKTATCEENKFPISVKGSFQSQVKGSK